MGGHQEGGRLLQVREEDSSSRRGSLMRRVYWGNERSSLKAVGDEREIEAAEETMRRKTSGSGVDATYSLAGHAN